MTPTTKAGQELSRHGPAGLSWNELDDAIEAIEREATQQALGKCMCEKCEPEWTTAILAEPSDD